MRWTNLVFSGVLCLVLGTGCSGGSNAPEEGTVDEQGDGPDAIVCGGFTNTGDAGDEATGVDEPGESDQLQAVTTDCTLAPVAPLPVPVLDSAAMVVLPGRQLLMVGGNRPPAHEAGKTAFSYDASTDTWTTLPELGSARRDLAAVRMGDGRVLVTGGLDESNTWLSSTEIFDPATSSFSPGPDMLATRGFHSAVLLDDGRVLVAGGANTGPDAEVYDPATGMFSELAGGPSQAPRAAKLPDGRVLLVGDRFATEATLFDPATNLFTQVGPMSSAHGIYPTVTALADGRVLVAGGLGAGFETELTDIFDPIDDSFTPGPDMTAQRGNHVAVRMGSGRVVILGGQVNGDVHATGECFDPVSNTFLELATGLPAPRQGMVGALLVD